MTLPYPKIGPTHLGSGWVEETVRQQIKINEKIQFKKITQTFKNKNFSWKPNKRFERNIWHYPEASSTYWGKKCTETRNVDYEGA